MSRRTLGLPDGDHVARARHDVNEAWNILERTPPTCEGGIAMSARALEFAGRARAHLDSIEDRATREANEDLFALTNRAGAAAHDTVRFFAGVCKAEHRAAAERPLFSRVAPKPKRKRRGK